MDGDKEKLNENDIPYDIPNLEKNRTIGDCEYHLCTSRNVEVETCPHCQKHFCLEHINPKLPMLPNFKDSKQFEIWKEGDRYHPCPDYYDYLCEKERFKSQKTSEVYDKLSDYHFPEKEELPKRRIKITPEIIPEKKEVSRDKPEFIRDISHTEKQDKPYFVPRSDNTYKPQIEESKSDEKPRPNYLYSLKNTLKDIRWTDKKILLIIILATVITNIIGMILLQGEIYGFPKSYCALTSLLGIFVTVIGIIGSYQSNRNYMNWDRREARWVRQWTKGVQSEQDTHSFTIGMMAITMGIGMCMMFLPLLVLLETIGGTIIFVLNLIYAVGILIFVRRVFGRRHR